MSEGFDSSVYHYHTDKMTKTLRATARGETPYRIQEPDKLKDFAGRLGLDTNKDQAQLPLDLADFVETDFNRKAYEPSWIVDLLAPQERKETWKKLDIFPGGGGLLRPFRRRDRVLSIPGESSGCRVGMPIRGMSLCSP